MDMAETKIEAQRILQHERSKTFFVSLVSFLFSTILFSAAVFGVYSIFTVRKYYTANENPVLLYSFYALFSLEVTISLFALSALKYNKKRWFYKNALQKTAFSYLFMREKFVVRLKVFYIYLFKKIMSLLCFLLCEIPFILSTGAAVYYLVGNSMYKSVFIAVLVLLSILFIIGIYFSAAVNKRYYFCEKIFFCDKKSGIVSAVKKSKSLTTGYRFRLVNYDLSFILWGMLCLFVFPLIYVAPYIEQSRGGIWYMFLGAENAVDKKTAPVVFMKPVKS